MNLRSIPDPVWYIAAAAIAALIAWRLVKKLPKAVAAATNEAGTAISETIFDATHPELQADVFNAPTIVDAQPDGIGGLHCPHGYTLKHGAARGWYCLHDN